MAVYDLEEQEQLDEIKTWWKQYGNLVTWIALAVAVGLASWQGWNAWQRNQAGQAASLYGALQVAVGKGDAKLVREAAGELIEKYPGTAYAGLAALMSAKVQAETGDPKTAKAQLGWAAEKAADDGVRHLARLRLAAVLLDEKAYDEALNQLAANPSPAMAARFAELRGDILAAQGKAADAKAAYESAIAKHDEMHKDDALRGKAYRDILQVKSESAASLVAGTAK